MENPPRVGDTPELKERLDPEIGKAAGLAAILVALEAVAAVVVSRGETGGQFRGIRGPGRAPRNRGELGAILEFHPVWYLTA